MPLGPGDDHPHEPGADGRWCETWGFELEGTPLRGLVRCTIVPARRVAWWWTCLAGGDLGRVVVRDEEVPLPRRSQSLELRGEGLWAELVCETPYEHWGIALEAFGLRVEALDDDMGERLPVGLDLEWEVGPVGEVSAPPEPVHIDGGTGYEQAGIVHGDVLVGAERIAYEGTCRRDHTWGETAWPTWPPRL